MSLISAPIKPAAISPVLAVVGARIKGLEIAKARIEVVKNFMIIKLIVVYKVQVGGGVFDTIADSRNVKFFS